MTDASIVADSFRVCLISHIVNYLPVKSSRCGFPNLESEMTFGWHLKPITGQYI